MCRKLALAATAAFLLIAPAALAQTRNPAPEKAPAPAAQPAAKVKASAQMRAAADRSDPLTRATFWYEQVAIDPKDAEAGVKLAAVLRALGRLPEAADAAKQVTLAHPRNIDAWLEIARANIADGQAFYAIDPLKEAKAIDPRDWRPVSLLAVAYEQVSRTDDALAAYQEALSLSPDNPAVLSNLGMFHAAKGEAGVAEGYLRRAVAQTGSTVQMRQNLAFVLGAQGKFTDAERLLREDLPPELANNNLAYLKAMKDGAAVKERTWESLRNGG